MSRIVDCTAAALAPVLDALGFELVDVEFEKKYGQDNLTVFVHKQGGVNLDDCERAHLAIDPVLEELDPTNGEPYVLNVSSPGLDRPFKTLRDFERNYGTEVEVKLYAPLLGKKVYEGVLLKYDSGCTTIKPTAEGVKAAAAKKNQDELKIENTRIAFVRPLVRF